MSDSRPDLTRRAKTWARLHVNHTCVAVDAPHRGNVTRELAAIARQLAVTHDSADDDVTAPFVRWQGQARSA